jgi:hypothetical protein
MAQIDVVEDVTDTGCAESARPRIAPLFGTLSALRLVVTSIEQTAAGCPSTELRDRLLGSSSRLRAELDILRQLQARRQEPGAVH